MSTSPRPADHPLVDGALVRLRAASELWIDRVPAVPVAQAVTATVSNDALARVPADELVARGIRLVGQHVPPRIGRGTVDLLIPAVVIESHPDWFRRLVAEAERVFDLSHGPVQHVLAAELETHRQGRSAGG